MTLNNTYPSRPLSSTSLPLDTIVSAATFFVAKWSPELRRNQSRDVLRAVLNKLYGASRGSLFHAHMRCSHAGLAEQLSLSREWICTLIGRLKREGWLETSAPRLPDGKQEITSFRPGRRLKRLLVMLLKSKQRSHKGRVNAGQQKIPTKQEIEKSKAFFAELRETLSKKMGMKT
jgi:hypothetical protein